MQIRLAPRAIAELGCCPPPRGCLEEHQSRQRCPEIRLEDRRDRTVRDNFRFMSFPRISASQELCDTRKPAICPIWSSIGVKDQVVLRRSIRGRSEMVQTLLRALRQFWLIARVTLLVLREKSHWRRLTPPSFSLPKIRHSRHRDCAKPRIHNLWTKFWLQY